MNTQSTNTTITLLPLSFLRVNDKGWLVNDGDPVYGKGCYATKGGLFRIKRTLGGRWRVWPTNDLLHRDIRLHKACKDSGMSDVFFPRRCDVLNAIMSFLQAEGIEVEI